MKGFSEGVVDSTSSSPCSIGTPDRTLTSDCSEPGSSDCKAPRTSFFSSIVASAFSVLETYREPSTGGKDYLVGNNGWSSTVKELVGGGSMRRIHERVLGPCRTGIPGAACDIWLLGVHYKISQEESCENASTSNELAALTHDLSSRILITYRKGFDVIGDSKLTSDVGWGCMLRSSQMLIAQALLFHRLGRSWRVSFSKPLDREYVDILHLFGDSEASAFSVHNLLQAGKPYGLSAGSWVGPYAVCRSWESLVRSKRKEMNAGFQSFPMAIYVVSGEEDGERGGAPIVCTEDVSRLCLEFSKGEENLMPILLLVPLVLGLDKINTRYIPSLQATFTFPQSLGILGGKPGASTYIVGMQDNNALYLDPHEVQPVVSISSDDIEADTSSYHCNIIRHIPLDSIDPSLAVGFYCRDKDDFDNFCKLASNLAEESNGAPLFTVSSSYKLSKPAFHDETSSNSDVVPADDSLGTVPMNDLGDSTQEDDWQLL